MTTRHFIAAAALIVLAACSQPAPQNTITDNIAANVSEPDITDVPDESADANASDVADADNSTGGNAANRAAKPRAK